MQATLSDLAVIAECWSDIDSYAEPRPFGGDNKIIKSERTREMIQHAIKSEKAHVLKACHDDHIVGTISGHIFERPTANLSSIGVIYSLWVMETYRNQGIGKSLLQAIEQSLLSIGAEACQVGWDTLNSYAGEWWKQQGYEPYETIASKSINQ